MTTLCGPVDHHGGDLLAPVGGQAVHEDGVRRRRAAITASSTMKPSKARLRAVGLGLEAHRRPHVGVHRVGALGRLVRSIGDGDVGGAEQAEVVELGVASGRSRAGEPMRMRHARQRRAAARGERATLLKSPTHATVRPARQPKRLAHREQVGERPGTGGAASDRRLTTGTRVGRGHALEVGVVEDPGAEEGVVAGERAGDVLGGLRGRRRRPRRGARRPGGRRAARRPSRVECRVRRLTASRRAAPRPCRRAAGRGRRVLGPVEHPASSSADRSSTSRKCLTLTLGQHLGEDGDGLVDLVVGDGQRRGEAQRRRRDGVDDEAGVEAGGGDGLGVEAGVPARRRQQAEAADGGDLGQRRAAPSVSRSPALAASTGDVEALHLGEHGPGRGGGERLAAVGRGVVAGLEGAGHLGLAPSRRRSGTPLPSALAMVTTSGRTPKCWKPNHRPVRPSPVCTSSTMSRIPRSSHSARTPCEVVAGGRVHAALALHRLEQDRGRRVGSRRRSSVVEVVPRDVAEPLGQRLERLVLGRLAGGVERGERAAVEAAVGADTTTWRPRPPELAGELDGALVGLGAGVGEEHLAAGRRAVADERSRVAATSSPGSVPYRFDTCSSVRACSARAAATAGLAWPRPVTARPGEEVEVAAGRRRPTARCPAPRTKVTGGRRVGRHQVRVGRATAWRRSRHQISVPR